MVCSYQNKLQILKSELIKLVGNRERHEYFSNNSIYYETIGKYKITSEGIINTSKI